MKRKIILSILGLLLVVSAGAVAAASYIRQTTSDLRNLVDLHEVEQLRRELIIQTQQVQADLYSTGTPLAEDLDRVVKDVASLDARAEMCHRCHHTPPVQAELSEMLNRIAAYKTSLSRYITAGASEEVMSRFKLEAARRGSEVRNAAESMSARATEHLRDKTRDALGQIERSKEILLVTLVITALVGLFVALYLAHSITAPLGHLLVATERIRAGEVGHTVTFRDSTEFGVLANSFNDMSTALQAGYAELRAANQKLQKEIQDRLQAESALVKSEVFLHTVFDSIQDPFYICDAQRRIVRVNDAFAALGGRAAADLVGEPCDSCTNILTSEGARERAETLRSGIAATWECLKTLPDGSQRWFEVHTYPIRDADGEIRFLFNYGRDVTERRRIAEDVLRSQKLESVALLAGGVAHDFSNLLTVILGNICLVQMMSDDESTSDLLADAETAASRAKELSQQLLTISRDGAPVRKPGSIAKLLHECSRRVGRRSRIRVDSEAQPRLWPAEIDAGQITQVLNNLLINAEQAMPEGGTITVRAENVTLADRDGARLEDGDYVRVTIADQGIGIAPALLTKIFDPYFTTKQRGSGLGLAITFSVLEKHGGHITVSSEVGVGSTFTFLLPASPDAIIRQEVLAVPVAGSGRVLVMDDDELVSNVSRRMLEQSGFDVVCVSDGSEALEAYEKAAASGQPFEAVLLDLVVPGGMGGKETMQRLKKLDPAVRAIVASGYAEDPVMSNHQEYGFLAALRKPFSVLELTRTVADIVNSLATSGRGR